MRQSSSGKLRLIFTAASLIIIGSLNILPIEKSVAQDQQNADREQRLQNRREIINRKLQEDQEQRRQAEQNSGGSITQPTPPVDNQPAENNNSITQPTPSVDNEKPARQTQEENKQPTRTLRERNQTRTRKVRVENETRTHRVRGENQTRIRRARVENEKPSQRIRVESQNPRLRTSATVRKQRTNNAVIRVRQQRGVTQPVNQYNYPRARG